MPSVVFGRFPISGKMSTHRCILQHYSCQSYSAVHVQNIPNLRIFQTLLSQADFGLDCVIQVNVPTVSNLAFLRGTDWFFSSPLLIVR